MMKKIISVLLLLISFTCFSSEKVSVTIQPNSPVVNEPFDLIFKIKLSGDEEPYISFDPGGASVTGRSNRGVSLKTTIINGKYTTTKEVTYVYSLLATRMGSLYIRNIKVDFGSGVNEKLKDLRLNVLREPKKPKDIFVMAIPSKSKVYVGEGFDVNYYLYQRVNVLGSELEKYPKLGDFLKRFHLVNETIETVKYKGELYRRSLKYSARLFAQKAGVAKLDPLKMKVQYSAGSRRSNFGFGIQLGQVRTRSFQSERLEVEVMPLPVENVPPYFSGLVGEHEFSLKIPRTKYVVNEAIEAKLEVKGVGALEAFEAPKILKHKDLEEFDSKGEIQPINKQIQKKTFEYTYLARSAFDIEEHIEKVAYFDPDKKQYITKEILVPKVSISGGAVKSSSYTNTPKSPVSKNDTIEPKSIGLGIVGINLGKIKSSNLIINVLNIVLFLLFLLLSLKTFSVKKTTSEKSVIAKGIIKSIYKGDQSFSSLYSVLNLISDDINMNITEKIKASNMSENSKKYFLSLVDSLERGTFSTEKSQKMKVNKKHFRELQQVIK
ncbi:BatD family protein [Halobacteriovorax sp.]|uniref:BatD family protein n=1 Tax=Halobacteriovorax sp. TaxID=2020862 RepID=UPI0035675DFB